MPDAKLTISYIKSLQAPHGGFSPKIHTDATIPSTLAAIRVLNYLGIAIPDIPNVEHCRKYVLARIDSSNGGIEDKEYKGETTVYSTSVGTLALVELGIASDALCSAILGYLGANTQNDFTNAYFAAFAWEAIHDALPELRLSDNTRQNWLNAIDAKNDGYGKYGGPDEIVAATAEAVAAKIRLAAGENYDLSATFLQESQNPDGGYGASIGSDSNIAITYEVMRAFSLLTSVNSGGQNGVWPLDSDGVITFVASCGNTDGGYGDPPADPSSAANPTYFATYTLEYLSTL
jgi:prenyltransferase beta subunit